MNGETSESTERMLSFIYPGSYVKITFDNVEDLLRISEKFIISKISKYCHDFLLYNFHSNYHRIIIEIHLSFYYVLYPSFLHDHHFFQYILAYHLQRS